MTFQALGMIETIGLPTAIAAADAASKAANVQLLGYDLATGGLVTVKLRGDVGAVQAAVLAGAQVGMGVGQVVSTHVIPRPHSALEAMTAQLVRGPAVVTVAEPAAKAARPPRKKKPVPSPEPAAQAEAAPAVPAGEFVVAEEEPLPVVIAQEVTIDEAGEITFVEEVMFEEGTPAAEVCNLCGDPACSRRKGQPHRLCMHWES